ncbi:MAG: hypothetical protein K2J63_07900 [Muribaculaceae bacterium]|nr:hypothetical protein [Muribaculaceae bacterium]MDE6795214.1 hypothetical protein [Muribaculaceae bacterium]
MLKKLLSTLVCLPFAFACFSAQLTATLQSGDQVTPFYGENAFVEAYEAAVDGDIITLSPGEFKSTDIKKSLTVIGAYAFTNDLSEATNLFNANVYADNVSIEGVRIREKVRIYHVDHLSISRCYIPLIEDKGGEYHTNTILTDCHVASFYALPLAQNMVLRNCCVNRFYSVNEKSNIILIENCNIPLWLKPGSTGYMQPYAIYRNCFLGGYSELPVSTKLESPSEFYDNLFVCFLGGALQNWTFDVSESIRNSNEWSYNYKVAASQVTDLLGSFKERIFNDKCYGVRDHKEYPAIPVVTSSEISTETDSEGNIHVKINASARD